MTRNRCFRGKKSQCAQGRKRYPVRDSQTAKVARVGMYGKHGAVEVWMGVGSNLNAYWQSRYGTMVVVGDYDSPEEVTRTGGNDLGGCWG